MAPITPVPTTAMLPDDDPERILKLRRSRKKTRVLGSIGLGAAPCHRGRFQGTVAASWSVGAQSKGFAIGLPQPDLPLSEPIREEAHRHFVRQGPLVLVDEEATGISDVSASRGGVFRRCGAQKITIGERPPFATPQLRRHVAIGRIQYKAERRLAQRMILDARLDVPFDAVS
jgi:hypothetical protein